MIAGLDPSRFWASFALLEAATGAAAAHHEESLASAVVQLETGYATATQASTNEITAAVTGVDNAVLDSTQKLMAHVIGTTESLLAAEHASTDTVTAEIHRVRQVAAQARTLAAVSVVVGAVALVLEVVLLLR